jgi:hypothetical protein
MKFKCNDWWTELGWTPVADSVKCVVCESKFGIAKGPLTDSQPLCSFHSKCTKTGIDTILLAKRTQQKISPTVWEPLRLNSYDRDSLIQYMDNDLLISSTEYTILNCARFDPPASVYDEALQLYAAELAKRLKSRHFTSPKDN